MLLRKNDLPKVTVENPRGGSGHLDRWDAIKEAIPCRNLSMMSVVELAPGSSIGNHQHVGNFEVYFIASGTGVVNDNGVEHAVAAGDLLLTQDGENHGITNTGSDTLRFLGFILSS